MLKLKVNDTEVEVEEGLTVLQACEKAGVEIPILVLHPQMHQLSTLIEHQLEPCVYSSRILHALEKVLVEQQSTTYPIHLKFNTGLHRLGFSIDEGASLKQHLASSPFHLQGVLSHLAATEDPAERAFTLKQLAQFDLLKPIFGSDPIYHVLNTSGVFQYPEAHHDMIRCGIGLYGYGNQEQVSKILRPVGVLKTIVMRAWSLEQLHSSCRHLSWGQRSKLEILNRSENMFQLIMVTKTKFLRFIKIYFYTDT